MNVTKHWMGWVEFLGVLAFFLGAMDPLEGCTVILFGSALVALIAYLKKRKYYKGYMAASLMIAFGAAYMIFIPLLPGGNPIDRYHWLLAPAIVYPAGWIWMVILLSIRVYRNRKPVDTRDAVPTVEPVKHSVAPIQLELTKKIGRKPKRINR